jgi:hypothetical protein
VKKNVFKQSKIQSYSKKIYKYLKINNLLKSCLKVLLLFIKQKLTHNYPGSEKKLVKKLELKK